MKLQETPLLPADTPQALKIALTKWMREVAIKVNGLDSATSGSLTDGDKGDIVVSGSGAVWSIDSSVITTAGRALIDDASASDQRATLGLGTAATTNATDYAISGGYAPALMMMGA